MCHAPKNALKYGKSAWFALGGGVRLSCAVEGFQRCRAQGR